MDKLNEIIECEYITSVGMLKRLDKHNIIHYAKEPSNITHDFGKLFNGKDGDCIYIKVAFLRYFLQNVLSMINYKFILITGDGDETIPIDLFDNNTFSSIINNEKIIHWYSVNCLQNMHPKLTLIPIGVNFHSLSFGEFCGWHHESMSPKQQEELIKTIKNESNTFDKRINKAYSNFHFVTYNEFGNPRKDAIEKINKDLVHYEPSFVSRYDTWVNQSKYTFVLSPLGHGMDCHRTWEALILGCIVIVKTSPLDSLYEDLPVLILNDWSEITEDLLSDTIERFKTMSFNYDKLKADYWVNKIKKH